MTPAVKSVSDGFECPNCHTLNSPNTEICNDCGIHFHVYDEVKHELNQKINERQDQFFRTIHDQTQLRLIEEQKNLKKDFVKKLIILLLVGIAVVPIIWGSLKIIQHQRVERQQFLELNYQKGIECLTTLDYRCANDFFQKVYLKDKNFEKCLNFLIEANFGIATTYFENGQISKSIEVLNYIVSLDPGNNQALILLDRYHKILGTEYKNQGNWQRAIDEFSLALIAMPDDFSTRDEIDEVFKLWIKEAKAKGEILKVWQLKNKLDIFKNK